MPIRDTFVPLTSSKTLWSILTLAMMMGVYAILPVWKENSIYKEVGSIPSQIHVALSMALGCLLVFRTNAAYNRWWEARTLWGGLINASRNLSIKLCHLTRLDETDLSQAKELICSFPNALKCHLRSEVETHLSENIKSLSGKFAHVPQGLVNRLYEILKVGRQKGQLDGDELRVIDTELLRFLDICGGCERIQRTRIVASYRTFARQCIMLFLVTLPWGIVRDFGWWTIPLTVITAYFMIGLEIVAEHVEEPFGYDEDDLDLEGMCLTIERSVTEVFTQQKSP